MRRRILAAITGTLIGITSGFALATPARADFWSVCGDFPGTVCLAAHVNWGTPVWRQYPNQITSYYNSCRDLTGFNDMMTMAINQSPHYVITIWQHASCEGESFTLPRDTQYANFSASWWNDRASSISAVAL